MSKIIGIDLGTTNSCVGVIDGKKPKILTNPDGQRTTPSVVLYEKSETIVGIRAKRQLATNPNVIASIKRKMGTNEKIEVAGKSYTPEQISAEIIRYLVTFAEKVVGKITGAVITVPAYFDNTQRQATKHAGEIAGLKVERIINEPTAAALAYGLDVEKNKEETVLVFDLGGGTFDVSILTIDDGTFEVIATDGNNHLGGDDFDKEIVNLLVAEFKTQYQIDLTEVPMAMQRLKDAAEKAKIELSGAPKADIHLPFISQVATGPVHLSYTLTRSKFEQITSNLLEEILQPLLNVLKTKKLTAADIDQVILVGGSTRMPMIQKLVERELKKKPNLKVNPDEAVAIGAGIQAGILQGDMKDILLLDVTSLSLGIETVGGVATKLIKRNTTVPTKKAQIFSTAADNQTSVDIHVVQGERPMAAENKSLGRFQLTGIEEAPRGVAQIEVTFDIDANQIVTVKAKDLKKNREQSITIKNAALKQEDIDRMVAEAEANKQKDEEKLRQVNLENRAQSLIFQIDKMLKQPTDKMDAKQKAAFAKSQDELTKQKTDLNTLLKEKKWTELEKKVNDFEAKLNQAQEFIKQQQSKSDAKSTDSKKGDNSDKKDNEPTDAEPVDKK